MNKSVKLKNQIIKNDTDKLTFARANCSDDPNMVNEEDY